MNRLFAEVVGGVARRAGTVQGAPAAVCAPAIDVLQNGDDLVVRAELPGTKPEDVDITVDNGVLTISGRVQEERQEEKGGYLARERRSGSFPQEPVAAPRCDESAINAGFENGVLEVTIRGAAAVQ
jgi:HSP20 family protein